MTTSNKALNEVTELTAKFQNAMLINADAMMIDYINSACESVLSSDRRKENVTLARKLLTSAQSNVKNVNSIKEYDCLNELTALLKHDEKQNDYAAKLLDSKSNKMFKMTIKSMTRKKSIDRVTMNHFVADNAHVALSTANRQTLMTLNALRALRAVSVDTSRQNQDCVVTKDVNFKALSEICLSF